MLTLAWFGLENLLLWSSLFKNLRYGIYAHAFFGSLAAAFMIVGSLMMIVSEGFGEIREEFLHMTLGFVLLVVMPLILISGTLCKIQQQSDSVEPRMVYLGNWGTQSWGGQ